MSRANESRGIDVPTNQLHPLHERKPHERSFKRLVASIRALGLIEPLCVYKEEGRYLILDGYLRFLACVELKIEKLPCLIYSQKEAYSFNKMVNRLSPIQENRMIQKSLETLDEKTIAQALGLAHLGDRLKKTLLSKLAPSVAKEYDAERINQACAKCMTFVKPERQEAILKEMEKAGDYTPAFARAMVIRTPARLRASLPANRKSPWDQEDTKQELLKRLGVVEQRYDFYTGLYRQYVTDLMKLCIYARKLITNEKMQGYLKKHHPDILTLFTRIVFETADVNAFAADSTGVAGTAAGD